MLDWLQKDEAQQIRIEAQIRTRCKQRFGLDGTITMDQFDGGSAGLQLLQTDKIYWDISADVKANWEGLEENTLLGITAKAKVC